MSTPTSDNGRHGLFFAMIKGVFVGFIVAFLFVLLATLFTALGTVSIFLTTDGIMGLFGFFLGLGLEVYPELLK